MTAESDEPPTLTAGCSDMREEPNAAPAPLAERQSSPIPASDGPEFGNLRPLRYSSAPAGEYASSYTVLYGTSAGGKSVATVTPAESQSSQTAVTDEPGIARLGRGPLLDGGGR